MMRRAVAPRLDTDSTCSVIEHWRHRKQYRGVLRMFTRHIAIACVGTIAFTLSASAALADQWTPISTTNAPTARTAHSAVFTRIDGTDQMIVWGGQDSGMTPFANTGGVWKRSTGRWTATASANAPD